MDRRAPQPGVYEVPGYIIAIEQSHAGRQPVTAWLPQALEDERPDFRCFLGGSTVSAKDQLGCITAGKETVVVAALPRSKEKSAIARYRRLAPAAAKHELSNQPSLESVHRAQLRSAYMTKLESVSNVNCTRNWLSALFNRELSFLGLIAAVDAMCLAGLEADNRDDQLRMVARIAYGRAVSSIQRELSRDVSQCDVERRLQVFLSIRILGNCESFPGISGNAAYSLDDPFGARIVHTVGAAKYLQLCGPELIQHVLTAAPANIGLFRNLRLQYALICATERKACFFGNPEWWNLSWSSEVTTPAAIARYNHRLEILFRSSALSERSDNLLGKPLSAWRAVASDLFKLRSDLDRWLRDMCSPTAYTWEGVSSNLRAPEGDDKCRPWTTGLFDAHQLSEAPKTPTPGLAAIPPTYAPIAELARAHFNSLHVDATLLRVITLASQQGVKLDIEGCTTEAVLEDIFVIMRQYCWVIPVRVHSAPENAVWDLELVTCYFERCQLQPDLEWCRTMGRILDAVSDVRDSVNPESIWYPWTVISSAAKPGIIRAPASASRLANVIKEDDNGYRSHDYYNLPQG